MRFSIFVLSTNVHACTEANRWKHRAIVIRWWDAFLAICTLAYINEDMHGVNNGRLVSMITTYREDILLCIRVGCLEHKCGRRIPVVGLWISLHDRSGQPEEQIVWMTLFRIFPLRICSSETKSKRDQVHETSTVVQGKFDGTFPLNDEITVQFCCP